VQRNLGWAGDVSTLTRADTSDLIGQLADHHLRCTLEPASHEQHVAWKSSIRILRDTFDDLTERAPETSGWYLIFEYELPRERGRRPDVVVLAGPTVIVLEFKETGYGLQAHIDQVKAYARDLGHYHSATHDRICTPILVLAGSPAPDAVLLDVWQSGPSGLPDLLLDLAEAGSGDSIDPGEWVAADYAPLPSLVTAARRIFEHEPLPSIRRAQSAGIPKTIESLTSVASRARESGARHLALVTGVPGAGKTLVGLQLVYATRFDGNEARRPAVFLSGNGPLVEVLQHALKSTVFVQHVHGFLKQYGGSASQSPEEHIWVYDEAQRAWDAERVAAKRGHSTSEPEDFLRLGERLDSWAMLVGLIGDGQEIHLGEEAGLEQWNEAISNVPGEWHMHCPSRVAHVFDAAASVSVSEELDLTRSLRSHLAGDVQLWVEYVLKGHFDRAADIAPLIEEQGFELYCTRELEVLKGYVRERYAGEEDKRYGLMASSKAKNLPAYGVHNEYHFTRRLRVGPWYNDPPDSDFSCCRLHDVVTEFSAQGLELDFPLVCWGEDLRWTGDRWQSPPQRRSKARDPHQLRINSYRVLLTRGRDGVAVFVPPDVSLRDTYRNLVTAGMTELR
jgi:hypothetical protein